MKKVVACLMLFSSGSVLFGADKISFEYLQKVAEKGSAGNSISEMQQDLHARSVATLEGIQEYPGVETVTRFFAYSNLRCNQIPVISRLSLSKFTALRVLNLQGVLLSGFDKDAFTDTPHLVSIDLDRCGLKEFPPVVGLNALCELFLSSNALSKVPDLSSLKSLRELRLTRNKIVTVEVKHLAPRLLCLMLSGNPVVEDKKNMQEISAKVSRFCCLDVKRK